MKREKLSKAAASGAVALIFLVLGFQAAIFTGNVFRYHSEHQVDTVCSAALSPPKEEDANAGQIMAEGMKGPATGVREGAERLTVREKDFHARHLPGSDSKASVDSEEKGSGIHDFDTNLPVAANGISKGLAPRQKPDYGDSRRVVAEKMDKAHKEPPRNFEFDPNTVTREELVRLGFSERQAQVIENYRSKGGKFNKPRDFAKMYVVDSATYSRLEPFIRIAHLNLNTADSLALLELRGIGPYYAHKILEYRNRLGGVFTGKEQLLEIDGIDADRLSGFADAVEVKPSRPRYTLWTATKGELADNPYIGNYAAKGIIRYRSVTDTASWSLSGLVENGILTEAAAGRVRYLDVRE